MKKLFILLVFAIAACGEATDPIPTTPTVYTDVKGNWTLTSPKLQGQFEIVAFGTKYFIYEGGSFTLNGKSYTTDRTEATVSVDHVNFVIYGGDMRVEIGNVLIEKGYLTMKGTKYLFDNGTATTVEGTITFTRSK